MISAGFIYELGRTSLSIGVGGGQDLISSNPALNSNSCSVIFHQIDVWRSKSNNNKCEGFLKNTKSISKVRFVELTKKYSIERSIIKSLFLKVKHFSARSIIYTNIFKIGGWYF